MKSNNPNLTPSPIGGKSKLARSAGKPRIQILPTTAGEVDALIQDLGFLTRHTGHLIGLLQCLHDNLGRVSADLQARRSGKGAAR